MSAARRRLQSPTGTVVWECTHPDKLHVPPTWHDTETEAKNRAALHKGAVIFPRIVDTNQEQSA